MHRTRTGGMTAIGILNIVFGAFGALGSLLIVLGGGLLAAGSAAMEASGDPAAAELSSLGMMGGGFILLIGLVAGVFSILTIVSGIGVLKLAPWGRVLCIVCGIGMFALSGLGIAGGDMGLGNLIGLVYGGLITVLCFTNTWRSAFSGDAHDEYDTGRGGLNEPMTAAPSFVGIPGAAPAEPVPAGEFNQPNQAAPSPIGGSNPNEAAPGFASMPGMPAPPPMPSNEDGDNANDDISDVAA